MPVFTTAVQQPLLLLLSIVDACCVICAVSDGGARSVYQVNLIRKGKQGAGKGKLIKYGVEKGRGANAKQSHKLKKGKSEGIQHRTEVKYRQEGYIILVG